MVFPQGSVARDNDADPVETAAVRRLLAGEPTLGGMLEVVKTAAVGEFVVARQWIQVWILHRFSSLFEGWGQLSTPNPQPYECVKYKTVKARFCPWYSVKSP